MASAWPFPISSPARLGIGCLASRHWSAAAWPSISRRSGFSAEPTRKSCARCSGEGGLTPMPADRQRMRVVSGIQPTGDLHLGNLLGAILRWVRMQDEAECLFFLADLHAITVDVDTDKLRSNVRQMAAALMASGIDPKKSILFAHSAVPAHPELAWILGCTARMGWLNRMTQF